MATEQIPDWAKNLAPGLGWEHGWMYCPGCGASANVAGERNPLILPVEPVHSRDCPLASPDAGMIKVERIDTTEPGWEEKTKEPGIIYMFEPPVNSPGSIRASYKEHRMLTDTEVAEVSATMAGL